MFRKFATTVSVMMGKATIFVVALLVVIGWAVAGPFFHFSNSWQLFINTFTTISTFLMVFVIQNTQNRDSKALQLKLDELLIKTRARDAFVDLEDMTDEELDELGREFQIIHEKLSTGKTMRKLHEKIEAEHAKRKSNNDFFGININPLNNKK